MNRFNNLDHWKRVLVCFFICTLVWGGQMKAFGQQHNIFHTGFYIGTNPVAIPLGFSINPESKRFLPIIAGNEYGTNIVGTYFYRLSRSIESRLSLSKVHPVAYVGQFHLGSNYYFQRNRILKGKLGWYVGAYAKYWDFYNQNTRTHFHNICPYLSLGYMKPVYRFLLDFRLNQSIAVYSWSSLDHSRANTDWMLSPWPELIPILPTFTFTVSYRI